jgi:SRSO17 transposase
MATRGERTHRLLAVHPACRHPITTLVRLAKIRWRIEHDYRELKHGLGLDHFEGRTYTGWHRHVTLTALAQAFCTMLRLDPKAHAPA